MEKKYLWHNWIVRTGMWLFIWFISVEVSAQEEVKHGGLRDTTVRIENRMLLTQPLSAPDKALLLPIEQLTKIPFTQPYHFNAPLDFSLEKPQGLPYYTHPSPMFRGDYSTSGLYSFGNGAFYGSGSQTTLPGLGGMNEASLGYIYQLNPRLSLQMGVDALKIYLPPFSVGQTFGVSGRLTYRASERISFNAFGTYQHGPSFGLRSHNYGATMKVGVTDRFNMEMGVSRHYNPMTGRWETVPVVIPSFKFNDKVELGLDVGGILYQIFHNVVIDNNQTYRGNPTIPPPRPFFQIR